jgi:ligand-binding sensor domain-containing protein/signal transduction histidine kinase
MAVNYKTAFFRTALLMCLLLVACSGARAEQLPIKSYTVASGIAHDEVRKIFADSHGFLWFCTVDGLSRFDGYRFTTYTAKDGLPFSFINDIIESRSGVYWIATNTGGISRFDPSAAKTTSAGQKSNALFTNYHLGDDASFNIITDMLEDRAGHIWAGTQGGLFRLEAGDKHGKFERVELNLKSRADQVLEIRDIAEDREGNLWIGTIMGLVRRAPDGRIDHYPLLPFQATNYLWVLMQDKEGKIWAGHQTGLLVFDPSLAAPTGTDLGAQEQPSKALLAGKATSKSQPETFRPHPALREARWYTSADGLPHNNLHALYQAMDGRIWIGTFGGGVSVYDGTRFRNYGEAQGLSNRINAIAEDRAGNMWIGTHTSGALKISRSGLVSYGESDGLSYPDIVSIFESPKGELLVISNKWTINRLDGEKFTSIRPALPPEILVSSSGRWVMIQDHLEEWWIATSQGLYRFPKVNRLEDLARVKPLAAYTMKDGLTDNYISRLFEDSRGDIWISSFNPPEMLTRWERSTNTFHRYAEKDGLPLYNWTNVFAEDKSGNLWIGLHNGGLARRRDGRFEIFGKEEGLPMGLGQGLYFDRQGRLWIATRGYGNGRIDDPSAERPLAVPFAAAESLSSENLRCFVEDESGHIYIGTARGVDRLNPATGQVKHFTTASGLIKSEVMAAYRDRHGALWFGTREGLSKLVLPPEQTPQPPPVLINAIRIAGVAQPISELGETEVTSLELAAGQNQIEVDFFGLDFAAGGNLRYQYKIEGMDRDWSVPTEQRTVTASLASGSYRFLVRAMNDDGATSLKPAVISFKILPPIWRRWWFLTLAALLIGAAVYAIDRYRVARAVELERVRTRIATDLHDDIGASLSQIAILSEVANQRVERKDSPITEPLTMIADTSREMVDSMSDIVWAINPNRDKLSDLSHRMRRFASDILSARDIRFQFHAPADGTESALGADLRREVYLMFKESVNNLVKHSECTEAKLELMTEGDSLIVKISDNGRGFDVEEMGNGHYEGMGGHGLGSMRKRAEGLGGSYSIESKKGQGTIITLKVPTAGGRLRGLRLRGLRLRNLLPK